MPCIRAREKKQHVDLYLSLKTSNFKKKKNNPITQGLNEAAAKRPKGGAAGRRFTPATHAGITVSVTRPRLAGTSVDVYSQLPMPDWRLDESCVSFCQLRRNAFQTRTARAKVSGTARLDERRRGSSVWSRRRREKTFLHALGIYGMEVNDKQDLVLKTVATPL